MMGEGGGWEKYTELEEHSLHLFKLYYIYSVSRRGDHGLTFKVYISGVLKLLSAAGGADPLNAATTQTLSLGQTGVSSPRPKRDTGSRQSRRCNTPKPAGRAEASAQATTALTGRCRRTGRPSAGGSGRRSAPLGTTESSRPPELPPSSLPAGGGDPKPPSPSPRQQRPRSCGTSRPPRSLTSPSPPGSAGLQPPGEACEAPVGGDGQMLITTLVFSSRSTLLKRRRYYKVCHQAVILTFPAGKQTNKQTKRFSDRSSGICTRKSYSWQRRRKETETARYKKLYTWRMMLPSKKINKLSSWQ